MDNTYNENIYLSYNDLNNIENTIETITNEIQERLFNNESSPLKNIEIGDNLNTKTLYLSFPRNMYEYISGDGTDIVKTDTNTNINYIQKEYESEYEILYDDYFIRILNYSKPGNENRIYYKNFAYINAFINAIERQLPYNAGVVNYIDTNNNIYDKIKIYENEDIIPDYVKHTWVENEILTMQKLHNIERGIKNIGRYFYKPQGWIETRKWLEGTGIKTQNISYQDLNRWIHNLSLINFDDIDTLNIWNTDITQIEWNKYYNEEWEDL